MQDSQIITESVDGIVIDIQTFLAEYVPLVEHQRVPTFVLGQIIAEGSSIAERWRGIFNNSVDEVTKNWNDLQYAIENGVDAKTQFSMSVVANKTQRRHNRLDAAMDEMQPFMGHIISVYEGRPQAYSSTEEFLADLPVVNEELPSAMPSATPSPISRDETPHVPWYKRIMGRGA